MKSILFTLILIILLSFKSYEPTFTVALPLTDWQSKVDMIEYTKKVLKNSSAPANIVIPLTDSLSKFQSEIIGQIQGQLKIDSTKKK